MKQSVYEKIKKQNGEAFARAIRDYDSGIFEVENLPQIVKYAGREAEPLLMFLESLKLEKMERCCSGTKSLEEILASAGYDFLIADTLEKQNKLRAFFAKNEELCTFKDSLRYQNYHILFLIKKGAENLNRADFLTPQREDEYATSLMSIQILKTGGFIKITNRYNHTVENPDNTFYSNPDYIALGLTDALKKQFNVDFSAGLVDVPNGFLYLKNGLYKYHLEMDNVYYGESSYVKNGVIHPLQKDYQILADNFIIDFKENKVFSVHEQDEELYPEDAFFSLLKQEMKDKKLTLQKEDKETYGVYLDGRCFLKVRNSQIVFAHLKTPIVASFPIFVHHPKIEEAYLDNLKSFAPNSFTSCPNLKVLSLNKVLFVPSNSIRNLPVLQQLALSDVQKVGQGAIVVLPNLIDLKMQKVRQIQSNSLMFLDKITNFQFYKLKKIGARVMSKNKELQKIMAPLLEKMGVGAVSENPLLQDVCLMNLKEVASKALCSNNKLALLVLNNVTSVGKGAISSNEQLKFLLMNALQTVGLNAFFFNPQLVYGEFETLQSVSHCNCFLKVHKDISFYMPNLRSGRMNLTVMTRKNVFLNRRQALIKER
ncbi:MAG: leucine-rich repeat protein [Alphaproteobacteria bacterium]|nr:leucine-rich repeat protein [Alphaproteobacteria bacterium]